MLDNRGHMKNIVNKNNVWGFLGVILLVAGQFLYKENFSGYGVTFDANLIEIYKGKKPNE